jgi:GH15 family glucan-1,4-alpha-glucosidase
VRVGTGDPTTTQIMYGIGGERRLTEFELPERPGSEASRPVRVGNAASEQFQLDVYGEVVAVMFHRRRDARPDRAAVVAALADVHRTRRDDLAQARRRIWEARTAAPLHVLQGDGLGRVRPRSAARRAVHTTRNVEPSRSTR